MDELKKLHEKIKQLDDEGIKSLSNFLDGYLYAKKLTADLSNDNSEKNYGETN